MIPQIEATGDPGTALRSLALLRIAVLLHRSRSTEPLPPLGIRVSGATLILSLPRDWLKAHPLTAADLKQEARYLEEAGLRLRLAR